MTDGGAIFGGSLGYSRTSSLRHVCYHKMNSYLELNTSDEFFIPMQNGGLSNSHLQPMNTSMSMMPAATVSSRATTLYDRIPSRPSSQLDNSQLRRLRRENSYRTALCPSVNQNTPCLYGNNCTFAHSVDELRLPQLRARPSKYKTELCAKFSRTGFCKYENRCQYIHKLQNDKIRQKRRRCGISDEQNVRPESYWRPVKSRPLPGYQFGGGMNNMNMSLPASQYPDPSSQIWYNQDLQSSQDVTAELSNMSESLLLYQNYLNQSLPACQVPSMPVNWFNPDVLGNPVPQTNDAMPSIMTPAMMASMLPTSTSTENSHNFAQTTSQQQPARRSVFPTIGRDLQKFFQQPPTLDF